jgi:DNA-binding XRE family transcriptional regulator
MVNRVKELRNKMGLTQMEFAKLVDIKHQPRIAEIENGRVLPRFSVMVRIAKVLKQPVERIFLF